MTYTPEHPKPEDAETLEHDAARLHREIEILDERTKAALKPLQEQRAAKAKELYKITHKLTQLRIKAMK